MEDAPMGVVSIEVLAPLIQTQKIIQVKAAAWAKLCGNALELQNALMELPVPKVDAKSVSVGPTTKAFAEQLKSAASEATLQALVECPVCFSTVFEPVTTPCGHTYCRRCLARSLDWESGCPLCRSKLSGFVDNYCVCTPLQDLLSTLWAEDHKRQMDESLAELREQRDGPWLPIIMCNVAFPTQPCNLHVYEPRYRLMIRRILSSGTHHFGVCVPANDEGELPEYGTEVLIKNTRMLPDGRSLVESIGARRFRVLESSVKDGYNSARVEYLEDGIDPSNFDRGQHVQEIVARLNAIQTALDSRPGDSRSPVEASARRFLELVLPSIQGQDMSLDQSDEFAWTVLYRLPVPHLVKYSFLAKLSKTERWIALVELLREFEDSLLSTNFHVVEMMASPHAQSPGPGDGSAENNQDNEDPWMESMNSVE
eukprot:gnl/MRDRNA2_/MRDRNA2_188065_c0_seq1.p1 gnl/MRDRNA2_/MRDRNA2_188065_c0~~gnl/MRDRNA2_/MRDRNA2_188065_c0_seq1.p1  ORF type:complete len:435 (+),score=56.45 gnl/MRDRNA2_/MRDRNA2_188065_c0_seq1:29-1306(+)